MKALKGCSVLSFSPFSSTLHFCCFLWTEQLMSVFNPVTEMNWVLFRLMSETREVLIGLVNK